jgi:uncharacterized membrane protein YeaQ/YmgE (transglycosylase-associated protein family)
MRGTDPAVAFILLLIIGVAAGLIFDRFAGPSWLVRQSAGMRGLVTVSLVGIAGSFIGYHIGVLIGLAGQAIALYLLAIVGAVAILFLWRTIR